MISTATLSELLASLHAAPLEEGNWQRFLSLLCETTETSTGYLMSHEKASQNTLMMAGGGVSYDPESLRLYNAHFSRCDPYVGPYSTNPRVGIIEGEELISREQLKRTEFFNDMMVCFGLSSSTLVPFVSSTARIGCVTLWRSAREGDLSKESEDLLQMLIPHLRSALGTLKALESSSERAFRAEAVLGATPTPAFLLSEDGSLVYMNEAAERLARRQDGIRVHRNRLVASDTSRQARLQALICYAAAASGAAATQPGGAITLPRSSGGRPLSALVSPLRLANDGQVSPAHVLVLITDPEASAALPRAMLSFLYALTSSEVEVANGLLAGLSLERIAEAREVSLGTARTQLKSLLHKTGTRRQAELVRLLLSLPRTSSWYSA